MPNSQGGRHKYYEARSIDRAGGRNDVFETRTGVVARGALDGLASRHRVFANNIANLETPGFQPGDVPFEAHLRKVRDDLLSQPNASSVPSIGSVAKTLARAFEVVPDDQASGREDLNGVQADRQMIRLEENTLTYEALAQATRMRAGLMRNVLTEGRG